MSPLRRRDLLLGAAGLLAACSSAPQAAPPPPAVPPDLKARVAWPRVGINGAAIGIGTGTRGGRGASQQTRLGEPALLGLMRAAHERGLTFLDTADSYGSHGHVRTLLREVPREGVQLVTKTHASDAATAKADIERYRSELGCDQLDVVMVHCVQEDDWLAARPGVLDALIDARSRGLVRAVGVSCHGFGALRTAVATEGIDVHLVRLNPLGLMMDASPAEVLPLVAQMHAAGRMVMGMKIFGGGRMKERADRRASMAWAWAEAGVHAVTVGVASMAELDELAEDVAGLGTASGP